MWLGQSKQVGRKKPQADPCFLGSVFRILSFPAIAGHIKGTDLRHILVVPKAQEFYDARWRSALPF